ncbi:hypothetical protein [Pseudonocardia acaciae]|uniref:hypothetical protein n=1 Tax=Pseudonocardia acaciae TaxID=551276 RepID=UPI000B1E5A51|nr:hypothetical protein [Pseudonocardia acaciae]
MTSFNGWDLATFTAAGFAMGNAATRAYDAAMERHDRKKAAKAGEDAQRTDSEKKGKRR